MESSREIIRILSDVVNASEGLESVPCMFADCPLSLQYDLISARKSGRYKGLLQKIIHDIKSGVPLYDIKIRGCKND